MVKIKQVGIGRMASGTIDGIDFIYVRKFKTEITIEIRK